MRKWIFPIILLLTFLFVFFRLAEVQEIASLLREGDWHFFLLATVVQITWFIVMSIGIRGLYHQLGVHETAWRVFLVNTSANFVSVIAPSSGASGLAVFLADARRRGHPLGRVTVAAILMIFFDYLSILLLAVAGFVYLSMHNRLRWHHLTAGSVVFVILCVLASLLFVGSRSTEKLASVLAFLARLVNRLTRLFLRRSVISELRARLLAGETADGVRELRNHPARFILPAVLILVNKPLMVMILALAFQAFNVSVSTGVLVTGFSLGFLFAIITPSPSLPGVVDSLLAISLTSLGVRLEAATIATLGFRAVTNWLSLLIGLVNFRILSAPVKPVEPPGIEEEPSRKSG
jgi:uncharacterized protein (TIRG00374 family)